MFFIQVFATNKIKKKILDIKIFTVGSIDTGDDGRPPNTVLIKIKFKGTFI